MTVNFVDNPYFEVEARKYRFRILNAAVSRFFKLALSDGSPIIQIANDGNLLPHPVTLTELDELGIAERYDIVIDFSRYAVGSKVSMVNLAQQANGRRPDADLSLSQALAGNSPDPVVGKFLEFRIVRTPANPDLSVVPDTMIPNPDLSGIPVARERNFEFATGGTQTTTASTGFVGPWGIKTDNQGPTLNADYGRVSAAPGFGTREVWTLKNGGGGWDHPVHIHFEEGQILARDGDPNAVPAWEKGRKDVYRLRPGGSLTLTMQFRDWGGMFMEHCHNTVHEDNAMLELPTGRCHAGPAPADAARGGSGGARARRARRLLGLSRLARPHLDARVHPAPRALRRAVRQRPDLHASSGRRRPARRGGQRRAAVATRTGRFPVAGPRHHGLAAGGWRKRRAHRSYRCRSAARARRRRRDGRRR